MDRVKRGEVMNGKTWGIFGAIVVVVIGGMVYMSMQKRLDVSDIASTASNTILPAEERNGEIGDHVFGNKDAKVLLVEYGDFQCNPGCRMFHENFEPIMRSEEYKDKIAFVYRHFPITQSHPHAIAAASAAEAAGKQDKFWDMWNVLFVNQSEWSAASVSERSSYFEEYARNIGLDIDQFKIDAASDAVSKKISFDRALASAAGVTGTPTVYLNGTQISGEEIGSTGAIKAQLDKAIAAAEASE